MAQGRLWILAGGLLAGLAVAAGAFAAHGLSTYFADKYAGQERTVAGSPVPAAQKYLADFKTAAEYQMYHALALIAVGLLAQRQPTPSPWLTVAGWSFLAGIVLFSGFLYVLTISGETRLGMIVPLGGSAFLVGWTFLALGAWQSQ